MTNCELKEILGNNNIILNSNFSNGQYNEFVESNFKWITNI